MHDLRPLSASPSQHTAPDLAQAIIGYRIWRLHQGQLYAPHQGALWQTVTHSKPCQGEEETSHPHPACPCGLYAYYDLAAAVEEMMHFFWREGEYLLGGVMTWGTVLVHQHGLRASSARIVALSDFITRDRDAVKVCAKAYDVPILPYQELASEVTKRGGSPSATLLLPTNM